MSDLISLTCLTGNVDLVKMVLSNYLDHLDEDEYTSEDLYADLNVSLAIAISCKYIDIIELLLEYTKPNSSRSFLSNSSLHKLERIRSFSENVHHAKESITKIFELIEEFENAFSSDDDSMSSDDDDDDDITDLSDEYYDDDDDDDYSESSMKLRSLPTNMLKESSSNSSETEDDDEGEQSFDEYVPNRETYLSDKKRKKKKRAQLLKLLKKDLKE